VEENEANFLVRYPVNGCDVDSKTKIASSGGHLAFKNIPAATIKQWGITNSYQCEGIK
jgi:hypothetical protein